MQTNKFPKVYACYDKVKEKYVTGARGQHVFDSTSGLKRSIGQDLKYNRIVKAHAFLVKHGLEKPLVEDYERLVLENENKSCPNLREDMRKIEKAIFDVTGMLNYHSVDKTAPHGELAAKFKFEFNKQTRFVVHTIESVTIKEL